jgi:hypothetical protein
LIAADECAGDPNPEFVSALSDEEIIEKASAAENSEKFLRL